MNSCRFLLPLFMLAFGMLTSARAQTCDLIPIALHVDAVRHAAPGALVTNILHGAGPGNFGWLTWAGSPSTPTLITSLTLPGDHTTFVNPDDASDRQLSAGDWVRGSPGVSNARGVRDALEALKGVPIAVPVWDVARGQGGNTAYRVMAFARIRLVSYQLPGQNRITAEYLGPAPCGVSNHAPIVLTGGDQTIMLPDAAMLGAVVTDDGLPAGSVLTVTWAQLDGPAGAVATIDDRHSTNTLVHFTEPGTYTFSITAYDSQVSSSNSVVVTVNRPNTAPLALGESFSNLEDTALDIALQGYDAEGSNLLFAITAAPRHGTLGGAAPHVRYTPLPDFHGADRFAFTVSDGALVSAPAVITITNLAVNDSPSAAPVEAGTLEDTPVTIEFSGADVDADPITFEVVAQPQHGTLDVTATNATYTPFTNYHGPDSFSYLARDASTSSAPALVAIHVASVNDPPAVDLGPDRLVSLPVNFLTVTSAVADVEFSASELRFAWSSTGSNGVTFDDADAPVTVATFPSNGVFRLRLSVTDLAATNSDELVVTVNAPPLVDAGPDQLITLPGPAWLAGQITDDALPTNHLAAIWHAEGPGPVLFADAAQPQTTATFSESGWHTLSLMADDGAARSTNSLRVLVNRAPVVDAGSTQIITNLTTAMAASVHDDGYPSNALVTTWEQVSGPGPVQFATNTPGAAVAFPTNGTYVLRLRADDGAADRTGDVTVHVNFPPHVDAGADRTIPFAQATLLGGSVVDDGVPPGTGLQVTWTIVSGPGTVALGDPGTAQTEAGFDQPGVYTLRLTATDWQWTVSDDVVVTVLPPNTAPIVSVPPRVIVNYPGAAALVGTVPNHGSLIRKRVVFFYFQSRRLPINNDA